ncbi:TetR/AcrR family transcriptional regulator [Gordonia sp. zg691]|uniref:TetR/AcrR family transcriptional regulator n=1 Tax=Gordonia jinghuaiqii TaxID=2758710 RepID=A0A7D7LXN5_9ACTN|nr:TetR/AcrR family transcriptional regulator [Gordonia jinghuaiqii]MBD0860547.1 TetR/AcrR family transcriptional regulator [Gordonia jinghuaiqii]MCR5978188.1 TetR family transcriptional regulator [Gordonia jinghuaiqii]QMT01356.1 TetR/AcrR family transcriptional regulator [Gordonia jinghuaiqii]
MPDRKPATRARGADRKRQLVDSAAALFLQRGYPQVSLADIARSAGVTAPSVYRHFDDKQSLLAAAVLAGVDDLEACTDRALADGHDAASLISTVCTLAVQRPQTASLWRWTSNYLTTEQNRQVAVRTREAIGRWAAALSAERDDLTDREAVQLAWALLSVSGSLTVHHTRMSSARARDEIETLIRRLVELRPSAAPPLDAAPAVAGVTRSRRDEILDAAAGLFAERGYTDVGVDEIGAAVGIAGPSVYKHFPSKLAILVAIGQRSGARLEAGVMAAYAATSDPAKLLATLVDSYVNVITSTPDLSVSFNNSPVLAGQASATDLVDVQRRYVARWVDLLTQVDPGLKRDQGAVAVHAALSIVNDAVRMRRGAHSPQFAARMAYLMKGVLAI